MAGLEPLRVLLVEVSATDTALVVEELRRTGRPIEFERVETTASMRAALQRKPWDLVIADWSVPEFSGRAALDLLRELQIDLPFIIVSAAIGEEHAVEAMRAGAHDYVPRDELGRLPPVIERELRERESRQARQQTELARRGAEHRMRRMIESAMVGVWFLGAEGKTSFMNQRMVQILGLSPDEAEHASVADFVDLEDRAGLADRLAQRTAGMPGSYEHRFRRRDGSIGWGVFESSPLYDEDGRFEGVLTVMTDVTERRCAEQANVALEEQLRQAQKMEAVGRLAGGIAHDFNNLLSVVLSYSDMLMADLKKGDPIRDDIEQIHRAGVRAAELTRQLLTFSRQQIIEPRALDLNELLSGMDRMLRRIVGEDVELTWIPGATSGWVHVDPGSIEQVIMNLAINARDAMPTGGRLTMETANVVLDEAYESSHLGAKPGSYVGLSVTDTGVGMDKATLARIFEPFFTTKQTGKGTGLGLATVFGIVKQSGGSIWVVSEPGAGTTFKIHLPRIDAPVGVSRPPPPSRTLRGSETVLLVEDEEQVRDAARGILRRHGYTVLEARSAGEALFLCERHEGPIHLLLTDVVMPRMSGPELAKRLVALRPEMKVLCMSGYTDDAAIRHGVLEPALAYLQKPITVDGLTRKVREVLGNGGSEGA